MQTLQHDTQSRFLQTVVRWVATHASAKGETQEKCIAQWKEWDGVGETNEAAFAQAVLARKYFVSLLIGRIRERFLPEAMRHIPYEWKIESAWELAIFEEREPALLAAFGLEARETAQWVLEKVLTQDLKEYSKTNRWTSQHPFKKAIPWFGNLFGVDEHPQVGFDTVVRVERPGSGASMRLVWNLSQPNGGSWIFPVGQSGHVLSKYFRNFRKLWFEGKYLPVIN